MCGADEVYLVPIAGLSYERLQGELLVFGLEFVFDEDVDRWVDDVVDQLDPDAFGVTLDRFPGEGVFFREVDLRVGFIGKSN